MTTRHLIMISLLLALLAQGCHRGRAPVKTAPPAPQEPRNVFLLLEDPDGHVGRITVSNPAGAQDLDKPRSATSTDSPNQAPSAPFLMDPAQISRIFGAALAAEPPAPVHFILYFDRDSTQPTEESLKLIPEVVRVIRERNSNDVSVVGHTDTTGNREYNYKLSLARAQSVSQLLVAAGVDPVLLEVTSHGKDNPLVPTGDNVAEPKNRRVEITVR